MRYILYFLFFIVTYFFISNDSLLVFLLGTIAIDYLLGIYIAIVLGKSPNSNDGKISSSSGYLGLMKKVGIFIMVWIGYQVDLNFNLNICKNMITVGYLVNEIVSINENFTIIGIEKNSAIKKIISVLEEFMEEGK